MPKKKSPQTIDLTNPDPLLMAARSGDVKTVDALLAAGIDPDICHPTPRATDNEVGVFGHASPDDSWWEQGDDHFGWTALHIAARQGHVKIARKLIDAGANVNATNRYDETPLLCAVWYRETKSNEEIELSLEIAGMLVDAGADLNAFNCTKDTPLLLAIFTRGALPIIELLVSAGADIHAQGALHLAIEENKPQVVKVLLASQKIHFKRKRNRKTPLELAKKLNRATIIRLLESAEKTSRK
jgi:ankyrin repeat protein